MSYLTAFGISFGIMFTVLVILHWPTKSRATDEPLVAYVHRRTGRIRMLPKRMDPAYVKNVYGMDRAPHLDFPEITEND